MSKKVLIIDDNDAILDAIQLALETEDYSVEINSTGENLLEKIQEFLPSIILLDILLSGKDGREIARELKDNPLTKNIPIIIMSAHPSAKNTIQQIGVEDFLPKPFELDELLKMVEKYSK